MDQRSPPEFILEAFADPSTVRDVVRGILHTIFFHRFFPSVQPQTREVLDLTLPLVDDVELETMIDQRAAALARQLDAAQSHQHHPSGGGRGQISVQFFEKKRRKTWLAMRGDEEVCWEWWTVKVTVAEPRTESDRAKVRKATEATLLTTTTKIITFVNTHKDHIPPITTTESNPFPYQITVNQKETGFRMGMY
ncbi:hypothetical protein GGTG_08236 [Gaeumannomyces tritici R3-111a-1]|uniref:Autophagy-related protein 101 n=1 Tax=Gaeumannomyces tritici (strain R3-111a-1) TaxID=644352 RepID=J3P401_GAET3|nr:hypothetical protein GGTG_08236 [Gaeumannomyces tritici R3-111a-1]EJT74395.1 hypothetical protein GGTG_08236 [Gaeumannomyces tritici R3-111a-1]